MNIPEEFKDYMLTTSHLSPSEQKERFTKMHMAEIRERAAMLKNLLFEKEAVKKRLKSYIECGFEFFELPEFYKLVDTIVDDVYSKVR